MPSAKNYCDAAEIGTLPRPAHLCSTLIYDPSSASASKDLDITLNAQRQCGSRPYVWTACQIKRPDMLHDIASYHMARTDSYTLRSLVCKASVRPSWGRSFHCAVVNIYRRFGTAYRSHLHGSRNPKCISFGFLDPWRWGTQVVLKCWCKFTTTCCLTTQKSADVIDIATVVWNHALHSFVQPLQESAKFDIVIYIYAVQQDTQSFSMSEFYSALNLVRHVSDLISPSSGAFCTSCIRRFGTW